MTAKGKVLMICTALALGVLLLLVIRPSVSWVELQQKAVVGTVSIVDDSTGMELQDVLLITCQEESQEIATHIIAHAQNTRFGVVTADIQRISSGHRIVQPEKSNVVHWTSDGMRTKLSQIEYIFVKDGYQITGLTDFTFHGYASQGHKAMVRLTPEHSGERDSDIGLVVNAESLATNILLKVNPQNRLRQCLVECLLRRIARIPTTSVSHQEAVTAADHLRAVK